MAYRVMVPEMHGRDLWCEKGVSSSSVVIPYCCGHLLSAASSVTPQYIILSLQLISFLTEDWSFLGETAASTFLLFNMSNRILSISLAALMLWSSPVRSFQPVLSPGISTRSRSRSPSIMLLSSATSSAHSPGSPSQSENISGNEKTRKNELQSKYSMPWTEAQDWALRDNLPKYTVMIPLENSAKEGSTTMVFGLWRTMLNEVPELAGYPIDFLRGISDEQIANESTKIQSTPQLLPYLEDYAFASAGGVSGKVYGVPGLADGTRIETSAVTNIEVTLPQGFVRTSDGKAAYELGRPRREEFSEAGDLASQSLTVAKTGPSALLKTVNNVGAGAADTMMEDTDGLLVRLGASTGILLAGATAVNLLSHHLTVNVFWV